MIDTDLRAFLIALATDAGDHVYIGNADYETTRPIVVIRRTGGSRGRTLGNVPLFARAQFAIDVLTNDYPTAYPIAFAIRDALDGKRGVMGATSLQSVRCISFPSDQSDVDGDNIVRWVAMEFLFTYSEG